MNQSPELLQVTTADEVAIIAMDNPPVNTITRQLRAQMLATLHQLESDKNLNKLIILGAGKTFCAGGDITEFDGVPPEPHLPDLVNYIESLRLITIAAIHGNCFGGGFEIALACDYRIATEDAKFSFPEVRLGLIPGAGGTQRLPRLIGLRPACDMLASGRLLSAQELVKMSALNSIVEQPLSTNALTYAKGIAHKSVAVSQREVESSAIDYLRQKYASGAAAPLHCVKAAGWALTEPFSRGQPQERELHLKLRQSAESKALRHVFFAERETAKPRYLKDTKARPLNEVAIVGGGLMGTGIAAAVILCGKSVYVIEQNAAAAEKALACTREILLAAHKRGKLPGGLKEAMSRCSAGTAMTQVNTSNLVIEAVFEDLEIKQKLFARLKEHAGANTILVTNTSYLNPAAIIPASHHHLAAGLHFFSPAQIMKLVEIVQLEGTSTQTLADLFQFVRELNKQPVQSGICDGFIGNRILAQYRREADYLLADGAMPQQIDLAMRDFGMPMGPYELQDLAGLQIAWANRKRMAATRSSHERYINIADQLCHIQRLGRRCGGGWYDYVDGQKQISATVQQIIESYSVKHKIKRSEFTATDIQERLLAVMFNEANLLLEEGIAANAGAIDVVKIAGYGFPRWLGGPVYYGEQNLATMRAAMRRVTEQSPDSWKISQHLA